MISFKTISYKLSLVGIAKDRNLFLENLSNLLQSGMSMVDSFEFVGKDVRNKTLRKIVMGMTESIRQWVPLDRVLEDSMLFSPHNITLVRMGQDSGRLNENIKIIVSEQRKSTEMNAKIRSALMYPAFVLILVLVVGTGIAWFILPKLAQVFNGLNLEIPAMTQAVIDLWVFLQHHGAVAVPFFFMMLGLSFYFIFFNDKTRIVWEFILYIIPGIKRLVREAEIAKFWFLLGTLFSAWLSPVTSLESLGKSTRSFRYRFFYAYLHSKMEDGFSFRESFQNYPKVNKLFDSAIQQVVVSGEQSGNLAESLIKLGKRYEAKIEQTTKDLSVMLEPLLLVIVWLWVVGIALAVIMPVYDLIWGIK